jgi:hypothetical protein
MPLLMARLAITDKMLLSITQLELIDKKLLSIAKAITQNPHIFRDIASNWTYPTISKT